MSREQDCAPLAGIAPREQALEVSNPCSRCKVVCLRQGIPRSAKGNVHLISAEGAGLCALGGGIPRSAVGDDTDACICRWSIRHAGRTYCSRNEKSSRNESGRLVFGGNLGISGTTVGKRYPLKILERSRERLIILRCSLRSGNLIHVRARRSRKH